MVITSEPTVHEDREIDTDADDEQEQEAVKPRGSRIAEILQKPFDFISMMVQFIIYFMVRMATEGCMLPMNELEEDNENNGDDDEEEEDEDEASGSEKKKK